MGKRTLFKNVILMFSIVILLVMMGCSVDNKYDLKKDLDMTISVGNGISFPLGATEKIMLTEMIDSVNSDVVVIDEDGYYSIVKNGDLTPTSFSVEAFEMDVFVESPITEHDFATSPLSYDDYDALPEWIKEQMGNSKFPYIVSEEISNIIDFQINQDVPSALRELKRLTPENDVQLTVKILVSSTNSASLNLLSEIDKIKLCKPVDNSTNAFSIDLPEYLNFDNNDNVSNGKGELDGYLKFDDSKDGLYYEKSFTITGMDFSLMPNGVLLVEDGKIYLDEVLHAYGYLQSDTAMLSINDLSSIDGIDVQFTVAIESMQVKTVYGKFDPEIDDDSETIDLELGDDLDFLNDAVLDFNNPIVYLYLNDEFQANINSNVYLKGYNKENQVIDGSNVETGFVIRANEMNNILLSRHGTEMSGYTSVTIPTLNNLFKKIPESVNMLLKHRVDQNNYYNIDLDRDVYIEGSYKLAIAMNFDELHLKYTESFDKILGDDPSEITDYIKEIPSITLTMTVANTIPAKFKPTVTAYKEDGITPLNNITFDVQNEVAAGKGFVNGVLTSPVESSITIKMSAKGNELISLNKLDVTFDGYGSGILNSREYMQISKMVVKIDKPIDIDLN